MPIWSDSISSTNGETSFVKDTIMGGEFQETGGAARDLLPEHSRKFQFCHVAVFINIGVDASVQRAGDARDDEMRSCARRSKNAILGADEFERDGVTCIRSSASSHCNGT